MEESLVVVVKEGSLDVAVVEMVTEVEEEEGVEEGSLDVAVVEVVTEVEEEEGEEEVEEEEGRVALEEEEEDGLPAEDANGTDDDG